MTRKKHILLFTFVLSISLYNVSFPQSGPMLMSPYLQAVTTNSIYVLVESFSTDTVFVEYGVTPSYGMKASTESYDTTTSSTFVHNVKIAGLTPNTLYYYRVWQWRSASGGSAFRTAPDPGTSFRFAWVADFRTGTAVHDSITKLVAEVNPVVSLYGGDLCLNSSYSMFKAQFFTPTELALSSRVPFFNTVGNHEKWSPNTQAFTQAPSSASGTQAYYSFDYGDMHVLVLNNEIPDSVNTPQYLFAQEDLSSTKRAWKVVICHRPAYCAGGHGEDKDMKYMSGKIFEPNHVDVVLSGHSHFFQHNLVNGIHHMVIGSAGAPLYDVGTAPYVVKSAKAYNFAITDVSPTSFRMMVYNERGMPLDTLVLKKPGGSKEK